MSRGARLKRNTFERRQRSQGGIVKRIFVLLAASLSLALVACAPKPATTVVSPAGPVPSGSFRATLTSPDEVLRATLVRSVEGTLGGEVYVYRRGLGSDLALTVFAVRGSLLTTISLPFAKPVRSDARPGVLRGGTLMLYERIPAGSSEIRIRSSVPGSVGESGTVWLTAPLDAIPVRHVVSPPNGDVF